MSQTAAKRRPGMVFALAAAVALAVGLLVALTATEPAEAAFPGENGRIAFASNRDGNVEIYTMNPDGSDQRRITNNPTSDFDPALSADGERIAFVSIRAGVSQIFAMNADGTGIMQVTRSKSSNDTPAWSPNGRKIVFDRYVDDRSRSDLFVINADGTGGNRITTSTASEYDPDWSADGKRIVYANHSRVDVSAICTISPNGSDRNCFQQDDDLDSRAPDFSPNGRLVVYEKSFSSDDSSYIVAADSDGSGRARIIRQGVSYPEDPVFSPDGRQIVFEDEVFPDGEPSTIQVFIANSANGSGYRRLTTDSQGQNFDPDWQPLP